MAIVNLIIEAGQGKTAPERRDGINVELFNISRPISEKHVDDATTMIFGGLDHPTTGEACLHGCDEDYGIYVGHKVNVTQLLAYFDKVPAAEKKALKDYIEANLGNKVPFKNLLPSTTIYISDQQLIDDGWFPEEIV